MKKITCLLLFIFTWHVNAQEVNFIPRAGLSLANTTNVDGSFRPGLNIGASAEFMFNKVVGTEVGLYFSMQGAKVSDPYYNLEHNYFNIPILFKIYGNRHWHFFAGPQVGLKVSANKRAYATKEEDNDFRKEVIDEDMTKPFDVAAVLGLGYQFDLGLVISGNVNIGLLNKAEDHFIFNEKEFSTNGESCKNTVIQINFGYRF